MQIDLTEAEVTELLSAFVLIEDEFGMMNDSLYQKLKKYKEMLRSELKC